MDRGKSHKGNRYDLIIISVLLAGCGGGGGGGGGGGQPTRPQLTQPEAVIRTFNPVEEQNSPTLFQIGADHVFRAGRTGQSVDIGVADSGVTADHDEFDRRVLGGGDWQGSASGLLDEHGHGTHVASLIAAANDGVGIQGVAPGSRIVSYRILGRSGTFQGQSGNVMVPGLLGDALARKLPVVNHSWSSYYEINDLTKSRIETLLRDEITAYRQIATETGPVMVWAAGNGGDNQVSVRSGLPYHLPELEPNWLTVVAVDTDGVEPSYTNRCGVAAAWCLTAPGGGDNQQQDGILGASHEDGYTRKSGTSMAAPMVSASIALLLEAIPGLTPRNAVARLKATATYDGLTTAGGCTEQSCGEVVMRDVFGHGLIQVDQALQPISPNAILLADGRRASLGESGLLLPSLLDRPVIDRLDGIAAVIEDDFDGTLFNLPITALTARAGTKARGGLKAQLAITHQQPDGRKFLLAGPGHVPGYVGGHAGGHVGGACLRPCCGRPAPAGYSGTASGAMGRICNSIGRQ